MTTPIKCCHCGQDIQAVLDDFGRKLALDAIDTFHHLIVDPEQRKRVAYDPGPWSQILKDLEAIERRSAAEAWTSIANWLRPNGGAFEEQSGITAFRTRVHGRALEMAAYLEGPPDLEMERLFDLAGENVAELRQQLEATRTALAGALNELATLGQTVTGAHHQANLSLEAKRQAEYANAGIIAELTEAQQIAESLRGALIVSNATTRRRGIERDLAVVNNGVLRTLLNACEVLLLNHHTYGAAEKLLTTRTCTDCVDADIFVRIKESLNVSREGALPTFQKEILAWVEYTFGVLALDSIERLMRFVEEVFELAQAKGLPLRVVQTIAERAYQRPAGEVDLELGGVMVTAMAFAESVGLNVDIEARREFDRVRAIPKERWQERHAEKVKAGIAHG